MPLRIQKLENMSIPEKHDYARRNEKEERLKMLLSMNPEGFSCG
jgi:hypothetical protein